MRVGGPTTGKSLHRGLREVPVMMTPSDIEQAKCIACGRAISDDRNYSKIATTCSARCCQHVVQMRVLGKPIEWNRTKGPTGYRVPRTAAQKRHHSEAMRRWWKQRHSEGAL